MPDELTSATVRVHEALRAMTCPEYDALVLLLTGNDPFPLGENPACRALAAAALNGVTEPGLLAMLESDLPTQE